jgi:hypothetical protein
MTTPKPTDVAVRDNEGERSHLLEEKPFDFIERTKPEDRLANTSHHGQLTRDNVNPNIPSAPRRQDGPGQQPVRDPGGIVDPRTLGMESIAGVAPPIAKTQEGEPVQGSVHSINEPPGSVPGGNEATIPPGGGTGGETQPLALESISPDTLPLQPSIIETVNITATGTGFTADTVMIYDDEEVETTVISSTSLRGAIPTTDVAGVYDVELQRGEELSDVLTFEFVDVSKSEGRVAKKPIERKPAKAKDAPRKPKGKGKK